MLSLDRMVIVMDVKTIINNFEDEIHHLVKNEKFDRKEAIKLVLLMANLQEISGKLD